MFPVVGNDWLNPDRRSCTRIQQPSNLQSRYACQYRTFRRPEFFRRQLVAAELRPLKLGFNRYCARYLHACVSSLS